MPAIALSVVVRASTWHVDRVSLLDVRHADAVHAGRQQADVEPGGVRAMHRPKQGEAEGSTRVLGGRGVRREGQVRVRSEWGESDINWLTPLFVMPPGTF